MRRARAALLLLALLPACGKKGDPLPPLRPTPAAVTGLRVAQRGEQVQVTFAAPQASTDGARLPVLEIEILVALGEGDFLKVARGRRIKAAPGEVLRESEPLPAPGTHLRIGARAFARGHRGNLGEPASLVVVAPLVPPADLTANATAEGVTLSWRGEVPAPLPTPTPKPLGPRPEGTPSPSVTPPPGDLRPEKPEVGPPAPGVADPRPPSTDPTGAPVAGPTPPPTPKPTQTPFAPGFYVYRRTVQTAFGPPLQPKAEQETTFFDAVKPGESWCYVVRAVASSDPLVESAASNEACVEVKDVVAPAAPVGLTALAQEAGIEVRWSSSLEGDVVAYRVYRMSRRGRLEPIGEVKAPATRFLDQVPSDSGRVRYVVKAVDGAGNESAPTLPVDVTRP